MVDNVEIPNINAFANFASAGGTVSLLDAELLQDVTFLTGGYPAPFINRTSSVLQVTQREGSRKEFGGWATLGFAGAGAIVEGPIGAGKGPQVMVVSARRSFLDLFTDDVGFGGVPVVYRSTPRPSTTSRPAIASGWSTSRGRRDSARPERVHRSRRGDCQLRHPLRRLAQRHGLQLATHLRVARRGPARHQPPEAKVGQQVKDLVAQGVPPPGVPPDAVIAQSPVVYLEDSREGETTVMRPDAAPAAVRHRAGRRQLQDVPHRLHGGVPYGNDTPYSPVAGIDPFYLDTQFRSYQSGAYLQASKQVASRVNSRWAGASTTTPSCRRRGSARARASTCASPIRCRGTRARDRTISSPRSSS